MDGSTSFSHRPADLGPYLEASRPFAGVTEAEERRLIAVTFGRAFARLKQARDHRAWVRKLNTSNPGAVVFFPEHLDLLSADIARYREVIRQSRRRLRGYAVYGAVG